MLFKEFRLRANLMQKDAAVMLNVSISTISMWETGKSSPRLQMLPRIAEIYSCTVADLLSETMPEENPSRPA